MWQELIWNIEFLRGIILLALGIIAAIFIIPWVLKRLQAQRDIRLARGLLKQWGGGCIGAISRLLPIGSRIEIEGYGHDSNSGRPVGDPMTLYWKDIREGKKNPKGCGMIIGKAVEKSVYTEEEFKWKEVPPEQTWPFHNGDPDVPRSWLRGILNAIYSKLDIFDLNMLPIQELEMALSSLDSMSQNGYVTRTKYTSFSHHLAQAFEKLATHLWNIESWSTNK